jgi:hypothetical protein
VFVLFQGSIQLVNQTHESYGVKFFYWLVLQVRANCAVAELLNVTASLVLTRVSRAPIGGLSNVAHPGRTSELSPAPIARMIGGGVVS